jgi:hypothetical protein
MLSLLLLSLLQEALDSCRQSSTPRCNHQLHPDNELINYTILYGFLWLGSRSDNSEMLLPRTRLVPRMMPRRMQRIPRMMRRMPRIMQEGSQEGCKEIATVRGSVLPFGIQTQHTPRRRSISFSLRVRAVMPSDWRGEAA